MNDADYEKQRQRLRGFVDKWKDLLRLDNHTINVTWDRSYSSEPAGQSARVDMSRWKYLEFDMHFFLPEFEGMSDADAEATVVHELTHCLLAPMARNMVPCDSDYQADLMELVTSQVESAILKVHRAVQPGPAGINKEQGSAPARTNENDKPKAPALDPKPPGEPRKCEVCEGPIPPGTHRLAKVCSDKCRDEKRRRYQNSQKFKAAPAPIAPPTPPVPNIPESEEAKAAADERRAAFMDPWDCEMCRNAGDLCMLHEKLTADGKRPPIGRGIDS